MIKNKMIILLVMSLLITSILPLTSMASSPCTVSGYVYANEEICDPEEIVLSFPGQDITADLFPDGFYVVDFNEQVGETGSFIVTVNGIGYTAEETITVQQGVIVYEIDLHITVPEIDTEPPTKVTGLTVTDAKDGKLNLEWDAAIDNVAVDHYNIYRDGTPIDTEDSTTYQDTGLTDGQEYCYQISAVDTSDLEGEKSDEECATPTETITPNNPPNKPINPEPENNSENISLNPQLSVFVTDPDGGTLNVSFYNASNDQLIATVIDDVENATNATVIWSGLDFNTYYHWYAIANDSEFETRSDVFTFKTIEEDNILPNVYFEKPEEGSLYLFGNKIFSGILKTPCILGKINMVVNATDNETGISRVELTIKGKWIEKTETLTEYPYTYEWSSFGFGKYNITATAYDMNGNSATTSMIVRKFL